mgnify:CR=1 FL=1
MKPLSTIKDGTFWAGYGAFIVLPFVSVFMIGRGFSLEIFVVSSLVYIFGACFILSQS